MLINREKIIFYSSMPKHNVVEAANKKSKELLVLKIKNFLWK